MSLIQDVSGISNEQRAHAERFAQQHLLAPEMAEHWRKFPVRREKLAGKSCFAMSMETLARLGALARVCTQLLQLAPSTAPVNWDKLRLQLGKRFSQPAHCPVQEDL